MKSIESSQNQSIPEAWSLKPEPSLKKCSWNKPTVTVTATENLSRESCDSKVCPQKKAMSAMKWVKVATLSTGAAAAVVCFVPHPLAGKKGVWRDIWQVPKKNPTSCFIHWHFLSLWRMPSREALHHHGAWELARLYCYKHDACLLLEYLLIVQHACRQGVSRKRCAQVFTRMLSGPECASSTPREPTMWHCGLQNTSWRLSTVGFLPCLLSSRECSVCLRLYFWGAASEINFI
jgi:hypothetical protein